MQAYPYQTWHLIGIGGIGVSGVARLLKARGLQVQGSDVRESQITTALREEGIAVTIGHAAANLAGAEVVVVSTAIPEGNAEIAAARAARTRIQPRPDGAQIDAAWLAAPVLLQDLIELLPQGRFRLAGRAADLLEIAGKRASLGELTRRLLAIPGVQDGVVFLPDTAGPVQRVAALVVAPELDEAAVFAALREVVDPVYLPRPLKRVSALPRNATGKLPLAALLEALRGS